MTDIISGCEYEELTLEYDDFSLKQIITNINTQNVTTCNVEKCVLVNRLDNLNEVSVKRGYNQSSFNISLVNPSENSYLKFSGKNIKYFSVLYLKLVNIIMMINLTIRLN